MADVKAAEISAILKQQLSGFEATASLDEVGTVLTVGDGIVRAYGLSNAQYGELVQFEGGLEGIVLNLEEDNVGVVIFGSDKSIIKCRWSVKPLGLYFVSRSLSHFKQE